MAGMSDASTVTIEEIPSTGKGRKIVLIGPSLPFQGADWPGEMGLVTTWYPGNTEGTQHVMGPRELPSAWEGVFRRTLMGKTPSLYTDENGATIKVTAPAFLRDAIESVIRGGMRLRVTWTQTRASDGKKFDIMREGRVKSWNFPHDRIEDIGWKLEFHWLSRGAPQQKVVTLREADLESNFAALDSYMNELAAKVFTDKIKNKKKGVKLSAGKLTIGQLEALAKGPQQSLDSVTRSLQQNINQIRRAVDVADSFRSAPYDVANSALAFARNNVAIINQYKERWSRQPPESQVTKTNVSDLTRSVSYLGESADSMDRLAAQSNQVAENLAKQKGFTGPRGEVMTNRATSKTVPGSVLSVHVAKAGDTPITLSVRYYGNADQALGILLANKLPPTTLVFNPGKILLIPTLPEASGSKAYTLLR